MKRLLTLLASLAIAVALGGCAKQGTSAEPPADFKVTDGDGLVLITWTAEPDVEYWIFYGPGSNITTDNWAQSGGRVVTKVASPYLLTGLVNGRTYSFTINGRKDGGPGGPGAPTQVAVPRLSGADWVAGEPLGTGRLNGAASGVTIAGFVDLAVGSGGTIYSALNGKDFAAATNPSAPADLNAAAYGTPGLVAAGANGTVLLSDDGTTWVAQASGTTATLHGATGNRTSGYLLVGEGGTILASNDGRIWVPPTTPGTASDLYGAAIGTGRFVAVGASGTIVSSTDFGTWTAASPPSSLDLRGVVQGSWTNDANETVSRWVAVGAAGTLVTSDDGATWTLRAPFTGKDLAAVTFGSQFVAVGSDGGIFTSADGLDWRARQSGTTANLTAIARTRTGYLVVGDQGTNLSTK